MDRTHRRSRRTVLATTAALATVGLAGCQSDSDDPDGGDGDSEPTEDDLQPALQTYVEYDSASELEPVIHPDSSIMAVDPQDDWELVRIKDFEMTGDGEVVVDYSAERTSDGISIERSATLREHEGEWLIYAGDSG